MECPVPTVNELTSNSDFDATDISARVMDKNYTIDCLEGFAMPTTPDATRSDTGVCTIDEDVPSVKWVYDNDQDQDSAGYGDQADEERYQYSGYGGNDDYGDDNIPP